MTRPWTAQMIAADQDFDGSPLLRREVTLDAGHGDVVSATLDVTALGIVEPYLGGRPVSEDVLTPGWSAFEWRLRYRSYDVTDLVTAASGDSAIVLGLALGNGWARGRLGWGGKRALYTDELGAFAELSITFADLHIQQVVTDTDPGWRAGPSTSTANDLYDGQSIDARRLDEAWLRPGADLTGWTGVHPIPFDVAKLVHHDGPTVRRQEAVAPQRVWTSPTGRRLLDFGQNLVGWLRFSVQGEAGSTVTIRYAEVLEHDELGVRPLRTAKATDTFVLSGGPDACETSQTFHGFRYVEVDGWPGEPDAGGVEAALAASLTAVVVHSDMERIGTFECSDELLNQLHRNVVWGLRGNFLDVPTDCPQRDERLGWTGDIAVFAPTAAYLYDVSGFLDNWMADLECEQVAAGGRVPFVVPDALKYQDMPKEFPEPESAAVWADAAVWVPWALWTAYGDRDALARHYPAMARHVRYVSGLLSENKLWDKGFQFGDWLDPQAPPDQPFKAQADNGVVATASYYRSLDLTAQAATLLGNHADAEEFDRLREAVREAFVEQYVDDDGIVTSDCPTVYALAITFGLLDGAQRELAGARLAELVAGNGHRIATGFAGTPYILDALSSTGHLDTAYLMLTEQGCPSWLYPITMGATTIWERWDSMLPDGSINPGEMTSFNHYALGAVADWMHRTIGGIAPASAGYDQVVVAPRPGGGITWARAGLATRHGLVAADWTIEADGAMSLRIQVPDGVSVLARLPRADEVTVGPGRHELTGRMS